MRMRVSYRVNVTWIDTCGNHTQEFFRISAWRYSEAKILAAKIADEELDGDKKWGYLID